MQARQQHGIYKCQADNMKIIKVTLMSIRRWHSSGHNSHNSICHTDVSGSEPAASRWGAVAWICWKGKPQQKLHYCWCMPSDLRARACEFDRRQLWSSPGIERWQKPARTAYNITFVCACQQVGRWAEKAHCYCNAIRNWLDWQRLLESHSGSKRSQPNCYGCCTCCHIL